VPDGSRFSQSSIINQKSEITNHHSLQYNGRQFAGEKGITMECKVIRTVEEWEQIASAWNTLLAGSASHVPFLRYEYLRTWWNTKGGGEWPDGELAIVTAWEGQHLIGVAPLFSAENRDGEPALMLLGSIEISDYLDIIARPENVTRFLSELLPFLAGLDTARPGSANSGSANPGSANGSGWKVLDWYNILEDSPTLPALEQSASALGWAYQAEKLQHSPHVPLPKDWETYLAGLDKKQRHEIRRKMRRMEGENQARWYIAANGGATGAAATIEAEGRAFLDLMAQDPSKAAFLTEPMRRQMLDTLLCAHQEGCLQLAFLEVGGEKAAGYFNFDYRDRIWVYNSGLDARFREHSPGWVLLGYMLQWAIENGRQEMDFMRGNEDYKYRFGAVDRFVMRAAVRRP
jgi:CelD/BcsL family acetyltransferase involved in cellulose biosynthesis